MIYRIDVQTAPLARGGEAAVDPLGEAIRHQIQEFGATVGSIRTARIFLIDADADRAQIEKAAGELLADPLVESAQLITAAPVETGKSRIEIHLKAGVMDPVAASTEMALRDMGIKVGEVRTGRAYVIDGVVAREELQSIASRVLANGVIESVHFDCYIPAKFETGRDYQFQLRHVSLRSLDDAGLQKLSREGHLFLSLAEMKAIQNYFRGQNREPSDIELETLAQTWSEHCVHKTLKSAVDVEVQDRSGKVVGTRHYKNLIKETIFDSTMELMRKDATGFCLSVFKDNAGVIAFDETDAVCFKVETHNHPSAIEPYGGSATGVGGVIRDILGTGLAAKPIANTDVFCVAFTKGPWGPGEPWQMRGSKVAVPFAPTSGPDSDIVHSVLGQLPTGASYFITRHVNNESIHYVKNETGLVMGYLLDPAPGKEDALKEGLASALDLMKKAGVPVIDLGTSKLPKGIIHPKRILQQVVAGVRDYGNRMGIPTVNGAVYFDDRYLGNPLVFCGCVGLIPRDKIEKETGVGDAIVVMGGRTGRDGIHGATFSSAELTDTHADEFSHAVQIGNAITEKKVGDVILQARDRGLFTAVTDCGAGGLSSAVGEMAEKIGAAVELERVPLKYAGLRYDEIWISEAQERMVMSVPKEKLDELLALSASEDVEATVIGTFGTPKQELILNYRNTEVGRMAMEFIHKGIPTPTRKAVVTEGGRGDTATRGHGESANEVPSPSTASSVPTSPRPNGSAALDLKIRLLALLAHPNIASKHWIIRQYDHEVQGGSVIKPLIGPLQIGPSDASVLRPKLNSHRGVVVGCGLAPQIEDAYDMALAAIDEAIRNVVAVGADPGKVAILDNFCWPSVDDEKTMGTLVRACEACRDAALAYGIPFISGKDSLHNQFTDSETGRVIRIPNTLLISAIGIIDDVRKCVTMDLKERGNTLYLVRPTKENRCPSLEDLIHTHRELARAMKIVGKSSGRQIVYSCHDVSDGGMLTAIAEMSIASGLGVWLNDNVWDEIEPFAERPGCYIVEIDPHIADFSEILTGHPYVGDEIGYVHDRPALDFPGTGGNRVEIPVEDLTRAWRGTLDW